MKAGQSITLPKCHVTGFPTPVVTWKKLTGSIPNDRVTYASSNGLVTLTSARKDDTGPYVCSAVSPLGKTSAVTTLVIWSAPRFVTRPPNSIKKHLGETLSLRCAATGGSVPIITWKRTLGAWVEERMEVLNGTLTISGPVKSDSGIYICEAKTPHFTIEARTHLAVKEG